MDLLFHKRLRGTLLAKAAFFSILSFLLPSMLCADTGTNAKPAPYHVVDGKVDRSTYLGWRVFHSVCYVCHGIDATGTTVAPNLVERVADMTAEDFTTTVLVRYRITLGASEAFTDDRSAVRQAFVEQVMKHERGELIMPAWERDPNVKPHVLDLYAYLKARADGALGPGRPAQLSD